MFSLSFLVFFLNILIFNGFLRLLPGEDAESDPSSSVPQELFLSAIFVRFFACSDLDICEHPFETSSIVWKANRFFDQILGTGICLVEFGDFGGFGA